MGITAGLDSLLLLLLLLLRCDNHLLGDRAAHPTIAAR
jgi:hypothetical protein